LVVSTEGLQATYSVEKLKTESTPVFRLMTTRSKTSSLCVLQTVQRLYIATSSLLVSPSAWRDVRALKRLDCFQYQQESSFSTE
jgi:hypothetical protein